MLALPRAVLENWRHRRSDRQTGTQRGPQVPSQTSPIAHWDSEPTQADAAPLERREHYFSRDGTRASISSSVCVRARAPPPRSYLSLFRNSFTHALHLGANYDQHQRSLFREH